MPVLVFCVLVQRAVTIFQIYRERSKLAEVVFFNQLEYRNRIEL